MTKASDVAKKKQQLDNFKTKVVDKFMNKETLYVEFIGRPSSGKSTTAYGVFAELKKAGVTTEFVPEYAKELVYQKDFTTLNDQLKVISEQNFRENLLNGVVDIVITDTSISLGSVYNESYNQNIIESLIEEMRGSKKYLTFYVNNSKGEYKDYGRTQTKEEALVLEDVIYQCAQRYCGDFLVIDKNGGAESVLGVLKERGVFVY